MTQQTAVHNECPPHSTLRCTDNTGTEQSRAFCVGTPLSAIEHMPFLSQTQHATDSPCSCQSPTGGRHTRTLKQLDQTFVSVVCELCLYSLQQQHNHTGTVWPLCVRVVCAYVCCRLTRSPSAASWSRHRTHASATDLLTNASGSLTGGGAVVQQITISCAGSAPPPPETLVENPVSTVVAHRLN